MCQFTLLRSILNILSLAVALVLCQSDTTTERSYLTSMTDKLHLLELDKQLIWNLDEYADKLQEKTDMIRRLVEELVDAHPAAMDREEFLSNPLHTYSLIRHMHADWPHLERFLQQPVGQEQIDFINKMHEELPTQWDVNEASAAIYRVQQTYALQPADMVRGLLDGVQFDAKLSVLDCYEMASFVFDLFEFADASKWLTTALQLADESHYDLNDLFNVSRNDIVLLLARSLAGEGKTEDARAVLKDAHLLSHQDEVLLADYNKKKLTMSDDAFYFERFSKKFVRLCGSSYKPKPSQLLCSYKTNPSDFLRLAPFKMEQLSKDPYIVVFHDVISDAEINELIRIGAPRLQRTGIVNKEGKPIPRFHHRSASGAWLASSRIKSSDAEKVLRLQTRIEDLTGLVLNGYSRSEIQLLSYVFGGHYSPHCDYFNLSSYEQERFATILFYLNNVPRGGATVFPELGLAVQPERGKVLYWYNVMPGTFDYEPRSMHGSCPVLLGKKLAFTNWIYEDDQMFRKPCFEPPRFRKFHSRSQKKRETKKCLSEN